MSIKNDKNRQNRIEKRIKMYEVNNPKLAEKLRGKLLGLIGKTTKK